MRDRVRIRLRLGGERRRDARPDRSAHEPSPKADPRRRRRVLHDRRRTRALDRQLQGRPRSGHAPRPRSEDRGRRDAGQRARRLRTGLGDHVGSRQARSRRPTDAQGRPPHRRRLEARRPRRAERCRLGRLRPRRDLDRTREPAHLPGRPDRRRRTRAQGVRRRYERPLDPGEHRGPAPVRSHRQARPRPSRGRTDARPGSRRARRDDLGPGQGAEHRVSGRSGPPARGRLVPGRPGRVRDPARVQVHVGDELRRSRRAPFQARGRRWTVAALGPHRPPENR